MNAVKRYFVPFITTIALGISISGCVKKDTADRERPPEPEVINLQPLDAPQPQTVATDNTSDNTSNNTMTGDTAPDMGQSDSQPAGAAQYQSAPQSARPKAAKHEPVKKEKNTSTPTKTKKAQNTSSESQSSAPTKDNQTDTPINKTASNAEEGADSSKIVNSDNSSRNSEEDAVDAAMKAAQPAI